MSIIVCHQCQQMVRWGVITQEEADLFSERIVILQGSANCSYHMAGLPGTEMQLSDELRAEMRSTLEGRGFPLLDQVQP